jgi:hypothetical protein
VDKQDRATSTNDSAGSARTPVQTAIARQDLTAQFTVLGVRAGAHCRRPALVRCPSPAILTAYGRYGNGN